MVRLVFACDVHGSEQVWKKWIKFSQIHHPDFLLMAGDVTGKAIVPLVKKSDGTWFCSWGRREGILKSAKELEEMKTLIKSRGFYPYETTEQECEELKNDEKKRHQLFENLMIDTMVEWLKFAEERTPKTTTIIVNPGNDDSDTIDATIRNNGRVIYPLDKAVPMGRFEMVSCEYVNPSPWNTPRELPEEELEKKLDGIASQVDNSDSLICNFHAPPFGTKLDVAPILDKELRPKTRLGQVMMEHVGSKAVRNFFEKRKPFLGLHGHIHESNGFDRVGSALCFNPGSEYNKGMLRAFIIDLPDSTTGKIEYLYAQV